VQGSAVCAGFRALVSNGQRQGTGCVSVFALPADLNLLLRCNPKMSRHQQDLPDATLFCRCLSLGRLAEWQFSPIGITSLPSRTASAMNWSVSLSKCEKTNTAFTDGYSAAFCGAPATEANTPPGLTLAISFAAVFRRRYPPPHRAAEDSQSRCRRRLRPPDQRRCLRLIHLLLQNSGDHSRPAILRSEYRRTSDISYCAKNQDRLARFDSRSCKQLVAGHRHQRQRRRSGSNQGPREYPLERPLSPRRVRHTCCPPLRTPGCRRRKVFNSRSDLHHGPRHIDSYQAGKWMG
jgi:hypothetical protein